MNCKPRSLNECIPQHDRPEHHQSIPGGPTRTAASASNAEFLLQRLPVHQRLDARQIIELLKHFLLHFPFEEMSLFYLRFLIHLKATGERMVFMSHKTSDTSTDNEARYITNQHGIWVYMAEWDDNVCGDSNELPNLIMNSISKSDGFLVNVSAKIAISMWIGYEIGGAHAMQKPRAKIIYNDVRRLPSVVKALSSLRNGHELVQWTNTMFLNCHPV